MLGDRQHVQVNTRKLAGHSHSAQFQQRHLGLPSAAMCRLGQATSLSAERCRKATFKLGVNSPRDTVLNKPTSHKSAALETTEEVSMRDTGNSLPYFSLFCSFSPLHCPLYTGGQQLARLRQVLTPPGGAAESNWIKSSEIR